MKNRYFVDAPLEPGSTVTITGEEFHHAVRVHRSKEGEEVELFDGRGTNVLARVVKLEREAATAEVVGRIDSRESPLHLTVAIALIQPEKFEFALQKCVEAGAAVVTPLTSDRVEVRVERIAGKLERWRRIVAEATKQSGRSVVPVIEPVAAFREVAARSDVARIIFDADAEPTQLPSSLGAVLLLIGPEGGWSSEEIGFAITSGCAVQRLGPRRLRAETAAIAAVFAAQARWGDMRMLNVEW